MMDRKRGGPRKTWKTARRKVTLDNVKEWADVVLKLVSILAILGGAGWAYYQFFYRRHTCK